MANSEIIGAGQDKGGIVPPKTLQEQAIEFKREKIREILAQLTENQKSFFNRIYPGGIDKIKEDKMNTAYDQCLRTFEKNNGRNDW